MKLLLTFGIMLIGFFYQTYAQSNKVDDIVPNDFTSIFDGSSLNG